MAGPISEVHRVDHQPSPPPPPSPPSLPPAAAVPLLYEDDLWTPRRRKALMQTSDRQEASSVNPESPPRFCDAPSRQFSSAVVRSQGDLDALRLPHAQQYGCHAVWIARSPDAGGRWVFRTKQTHTCKDGVPADQPYESQDPVDLACERGEGVVEPCVVHRQRIYCAIVYTRNRFVSDHTDDPRRRLNPLPSLLWMLAMRHILPETAVGNGIAEDDSHAVVTFRGTVSHPINIRFRNLSTEQKRSRDACLTRSSLVGWALRAPSRAVGSNRNSSNSVAEADVDVASTLVLPSSTGVHGTDDSGSSGSAAGADVAVASTLVLPSTCTSGTDERSPGHGERVEGMAALREWPPAHTPQTLFCVYNRQHLADVPVPRVYVDGCIRVWVAPVSADDVKGSVALRWTHAPGCPNSCQRNYNMQKILSKFAKGLPLHSKEQPTGRPSVRWLSTCAALLFLVVVHNIFAAIESDLCSGPSESSSSSGECEAPHVELQFFPGHKDGKVMRTRWYNLRPHQLNGVCVYSKVRTSPASSKAPTIASMRVALPPPTPAETRRDHGAASTQTSSTAAIQSTQPLSSSTSAPSLSSSLPLSSFSSSSSPAAASAQTVDSMETVDDSGTVELDSAPVVFESGEDERPDGLSEVPEAPPMPGAMPPFLVCSC